MAAKREKVWKEKDVYIVLCLSLTSCFESILRKKACSFAANIVELEACAEKAVVS